MSKFVEVAREGDVADGAMREVSAEGQKILLARIGGRYYAVQGSCPHMGASLASGNGGDSAYLPATRVAV